MYAVEVAAVFWKNCLIGYDESINSLNKSWEVNDAFDQEYFLTLISDTSLFPFQSIGCDG